MISDFKTFSRSQDRREGRVLVEVAKMSLMVICRKIDVSAFSFAKRTANSPRRSSCDDIRSIVHLSSAEFVVEGNDEL
jgi:hypothetical protein